jgi:D-alanyl-D-alanine-carboxypeptidase/D-alanyl-D-alanine-endopeptidase
MMRVVFRCYLSALLLLPAAAAAQAPAINPDTAAQRLGTRFVTAGGHVGLSIGVIDRGRTYFYNFGTTELGANRPPTAATLYEIGSITKTFTSLLLAQAVVEKKVALNDDIRQYLDGQYPNLAYAGQPIRLLHLANTTSDLPDNLPDRPDIFQGKLSPDSLAAAFYRLHQHYRRPQFYQDLHRVKLGRAPGTQPQHSNAAAQLLSYILERVYKMPYEQLVQRYILAPNGMTSTVPTTAVPAGRATLQAKGYSRENHTTPFNAVPDLLPAGGFSSTPADMLHYLQLQLAKNNPAVQLTHQPTHGSVEAEAIGLNWFITKSADSKLAFSHSGGTFGFASYCVFYPELNRGFVLLANKNSGSTETRLAELAAALEESTFGVPPGLQAFRQELVKRSYQGALAIFSATRRQYPELFLSEDYVNSWGYVLLRQAQPRAAIGVFQLNAGLYPNSANAYDSLAEAYEASGERELATQNYRRSLALNPANDNAAEHLKKLGASSN